MFAGNSTPFSLTLVPVKPEGGSATVLISARCVTASRSSGPSRASQCGNLFGRGWSAFDRFKHLQDVLRLLSVNAAHHEALQAFVFRGHANTVVAMVLRRMRCES